MKKVLFIALLIGSFGMAAKAQNVRRLNVSAGVSRSAAVSSRDFHLKQFSAGLTFSIRLNRQWSLVTGVSKSFDARPLMLRTGVSVRLY